MKKLCERVRAILMEESNIQPVSSPVTICGDIHGQFWDLLELLRKGGDVPETSYIFMARMCSFRRVMQTFMFPRVISWTGGTTAWRLLHYCSLSKQGRRNPLIRHPYNLIAKQDTPIK